MHRMLAERTILARCRCHAQRVNPESSPTATAMALIMSRPLRTSTRLASWSPDRSGYHDQHTHAKGCDKPQLDSQVSRGPYPGRENTGDDEDYTELLRAAYERLEPDLRSRKAVLMNKRVGSKVRKRRWGAVITLFQPQPYP